MECDHCFPSQPFVVLTVDQFVGHGEETGWPRLSKNWEALC